jgi:hypothetical protein
MENTDMLTFTQFVIEHSEEVEEELSPAARKKKGMMMRRMKGKLKLGQKKAARRTASSDTIKKRARRSAIANLSKKLGGKSKSDMSVSQKKSIEKRVKRQGARVNTLARKGRAAARKRDRA